MSNFCGKCGEKFISDEQKFCGACGASRNLNGLKTSEMDLMSVCTQISEKLNILSKNGDLETFVQGDASTVHFALLARATALGAFTPSLRISEDIIKIALEVLSW